MKLTKDESEFLQEWEIQRKNKTRNIIFASLLFAVVAVITNSLFTVFDPQLNFHPEQFNIKKEMRQFVSAAVIWGSIRAIEYYYKENKYKKLLKKKEA
jgi:hypothetical protein